VILDLVGGVYLADNIKVIASRGKLVVVGLVGGAAAELPLGLLLAKRAQVIGTVLRSRALEEKIAVAQAFAKNVLPLFASGKLKPVPEVVLPMSEIREAHRLMESNTTFGKIVLTWE
jgi:NADPH:quinone reductase-like Zn-dependent oxidoreductase